MYKPSFKVKKSGMPVLNKNEIDIIGERFIEDFVPEALSIPQPIDIDSFVERYLGMTTDYQYLSHNGVYLGMTIFNDTDKVTIFSPETGRAEYISAKARTVIIDNRLLDENQEHRYRFTMAHEGAHDICHLRYFFYDPNQISFFDAPASPMIQCRIDNTKFEGNRSNHAWDDYDWMEWQANKMASALLMPKSAVKIVVDNCKETRPNYRSYSLIWAVSEAFNVSTEAATYRLQELGYVNDVDYKNNRSVIDMFPLLLDML